MSSHVENEIQARIARVRAEAERKRQEREELARRRAAGLAKRHAQKLRRLAEKGLDLAPPVDLSNETLAASGAL
ncbi:hypothetical protein [Streptomyces sp. NPDC050416]|uniref:hypothetical protein n=1 Tax=Streptomyces sp. NPDC050416 TaxID=3365611 RepID=UPI0037966783